MSYVQVENPALTVFSREIASLSPFYGCKSSKKHCFEIIGFFLWENAVVYHLFMDSCIYKISKKTMLWPLGIFHGRGLQSIIILWIHLYIIAKYVENRTLSLLYLYLKNAEIYHLLALQLISIITHVPCHKLKAKSYAAHFGHLILGVMERKADIKW